MHDRHVQGSELRVPRAGWFCLVLAALMLLPAGSVHATAPTVTYLPASDSALAAGQGCSAPAFPAGAIELNFGAGGNCTAGSNCDIAVTSNADGSGTGILDRTVVGCTLSTLSGSNSAVSAGVFQNGVEGGIQFIGSQPGSGVIRVGCVPVAQVTQARLCCSQVTRNLTTYPFWDISCPPATLPQFSSSPAPGALPALTTTPGAPVSTSITVNSIGTANLVVTAAGLSGSLSVSPPGPQTIAPGGQRVFTVSCAPTFAGSTTQLLSLASNDADNNPAVYSASCTGTNPPAPKFSSSPAPPGNLSISTTQGSTGQASLTISNNTGGSGPLTVAFSNLDGVFSASPGGTLAVGASTTFSIFCSGAVPGNFFDTFTVLTNDPAAASVSFNVSCSVSAAPVPVYNSTPAAPGPLGISTTVNTSGTTTLTVSNSGNAPLIVGSLGGIAAPFGVNPTSATIGPGQQQAFAISCLSAAAGSFNATLTVNTNDSTASAVRYNLSCAINNVAAPEFNATPSSPGPLNIVTTPSVPGSAALSVQNVGGAPLTISSVSGVGNPFSLSPSPPQTLAAGATQNFQIACNSSAAGQFNAVMTLATNDSDEAAVPFNLGCSVNGVADFSSVPPPGPIAMSTTQGVNDTAIVTVSNSGTGPLVISQISGLSSPLSVSPNSASIAPGASRAFTVTCAAANAGAFANTMVMTTNDSTPSSTRSYNVSCTVATSVGPPAFSSSPASGSTLPPVSLPLGSSNGTVDIIVSNTAAAGSQSLSISAAGLSAPLEVYPAQESVPPGESRTITVSCTPTAIGTSTQTLLLDTNAPTPPGPNPASYAVSCEGTPGPVFESLPLPAIGFNFDTVRGQPRADLLRVRNTGAVDLYLAFGGLGDGLYAEPQTAGLCTGPSTDGFYDCTIPAAASLSVTVGCRALLVGSLAQSLVVYTNDINQFNVFYPVTCDIRQDELALAAIRGALSGARIPQARQIFKDGFEDQ